MKSAKERLAERRAAAAQRPAVDLADLVATPVMHQGARPTCVPCALAAAHEVERIKDAFEAAIEPIWWHLHQHGGASERGTTLRAAANALADVGHCDASTWPYNATLGVGTEPPPAALDQPPWRIADLPEVRLAHDSVEDELEDELAAGHTVVLIIEATDSFCYPDADGYVATPTIRVPSVGYHAVLVVGAWTDPIIGRVLLIRNSWGDAWGVGGYCTIGVEYLVAFAVQAARVVPK